MSKRWYRVALATLAALVTLVACGDDGTSLGDGGEPVAVDLILGFSVGGQDAPLYLGIEEGFFEEEGIDLTIRPGEGSAVAVSTVTAGEVEFGVSDLASVVLAHAQDPEAPVKAVASQQAVAPYVIFSLASNANLDQPADLNGAEIYISSQSTMRQLFDAWAARVGVEGYTFAEVDQQSAAQLLLAGEIPNNGSFITIKESFEQEAESAGEELVTLWLGEHGMDDFYGNVFIVNTDFAADNPELVEGFVRAMIRSYEYGFANQEEAAEVLEREVPTLTKEVSLLRMPTQEELATYGGASIGDLIGSQVTSTIAYVKEGLGFEGEVTAEDVVLDGYLK